MRAEIKPAPPVTTLDVATTGAPPTKIASQNGFLTQAGYAIGRRAWHVWAGSYAALSALVIVRAATMIFMGLLDGGNPRDFPDAHELHTVLESNFVVLFLRNGWIIPTILTITMMASSAIYIHSSKWPLYILGEVAITGVMCGILAFVTLILFATTMMWTSELGREIFLLLWVPLLLGVMWNKITLVSVWRDWADGYLTGNNLTTAREPIIAKSKFAERQHSGISDTEI